MISVVIPTLNEAEALPLLLADLARESGLAEIIVVDGGSRDGTQDIARQAGARLVEAPAGRGTQLHAGASTARGAIILFLHADSRFPAGGAARIAEELAAQRRAPGGNFRLVFDGGDSFCTWLTGFYAWMRRRGLYYGDSGIFVRRETYAALGGFRGHDILEDYDFVRRLERAGPTLCLAEPPLVTSARKFAGRRPVAIVAGWLWLHALYALGVAPQRLARRYYRTTKRVHGASLRAQ